MALTAIKHQEILPPEVASYLSATGDYNPGASNPSVQPKGNTGNSHFTAAEYWNVHAEGLYSYEQYIDALKHGKIVCLIVQEGIFIGWDGSHEVLIYGTIP